MNKTRTKWIRKLFKDKDSNLLLSVHEIVKRSKVRRQPFRVAKSMWCRNDPATKTWGK